MVELLRAHASSGGWCIYIQGQGGLKRELAKHRIKDMMMIAERPAEAADRAIPGHWEGDLIMGSTASNSAIGTLVEKATSFTVLVPLPRGYGALAFRESLVEAVAELPATLRKTLTWDQGIEMVNHAAIADATGLEVYLCHEDASAGPPRPKPSIDYCPNTITATVLR